jgi:hydroxymethylglutaryl-CoA lyase
MTDIDIEIGEVGPRDGLQNTKAIMPTDAKRAWIDALAGAGLREIEVCSFVPPKLVPQMADAAEATRHALAIPGLRVAVLVPNLKGAERAMEIGAHKLTLPVSVSRSHGLANVRRTREEMVAEVRRVCELRDAQPAARRPKVEAGLSTAFGCTMEGRVAEADVIRLAVALAETGCDAVGLSDTVGYANPAQVKRVFTALRAEIGERTGGGHFHDTRGLGLANVLAAMEAGVRSFDASLGGLGGCPFAPGASGNVATEDLAFMLESMGLRTGVDLDRLLAARELLARSLPGEPLYGHVALAGLPKGHRRHAA